MAGRLDYASRPAMNPTMTTESSITPASIALQGQTVSPGAAFGPILIRDEGFGDVKVRQLKASEIDEEQARLDSAARGARVALVHQRNSLAGRFTEEQRRIFDAHLKILEDPQVEADIRNRIQEGQNLESSVREVLEIYERLCAVVETEGMRNKLSDLRDVAVRFLQHCRRHEASVQVAVPSGGILVVQELSVSDLTFALENNVRAIVAEGGTMGSHGTILTRAAGLPALIGVEGIFEAATAATNGLVEGETGQIILDPDNDVVSSALGRVAQLDPVEEMGPARLSDGTQVILEAAIASPAEARRAVANGVPHVGLYRTELPLIQRKGAPREDSLTKFHSKVLRTVDSIIFRLPDLDPSTGLDRFFPARDEGAKLGLRGARVLFDNPEMLAVQIRGILRACEGRPVQIAVPFILDCADLDRMRDAVESAREELRLDGVDVSHPVELGAVFETPASALLGREIMSSCDFAMVGYDVLSELLLAADSSCFQDSVRQLAERPHPAVLRAIRKLVQLAEGLNRKIRIYGERVTMQQHLPLLLGLGFRNFVLRPGLLQTTHQLLENLDLDSCERLAEAACRTSSCDELAALIANHRPAS